MILLLLNILLQYFDSYSILSPSFDIMKIEWIKHKSVDKSKFLTKKNIWWEFEVVLLT